MPFFLHGVAASGIIALPLPRQSSVAVVHFGSPSLDEGCFPRGQWQGTGRWWQQMQSRPIVEDKPSKLPGRGREAKVHDARMRGVSFRNRTWSPSTCLKHWRSENREEWGRFGLVIPLLCGEIAVPRKWKRRTQGIRSCTGCTQRPHQLASWTCPPTVRWQSQQKIIRLGGGHAGLFLLRSDMQTMVGRYFCRRTGLRSR